MKRHSTPQSVIDAIVTDVRQYYAGDIPWWVITWGAETLPLSTFIAQAAHHWMRTIESYDGPNDGPISLTRLDGETKIIPALDHHDWPADSDEFSAAVEQAVRDITDWADSTDFELTFGACAFNPAHRDQGSDIDTNGDTVEEVEADMLDFLNTSDWNNGDFRVVRYEQNDRTIPSLAEFDPIDGDLTIVIEGTNTVEGEMEEIVCLVTATIYPYYM